MAKKYVKRFDKRAADLRAHVRSAAAVEGSKLKRFEKQIVKTLDIYSKGFNELVMIDGKIAKDKAAFRAAVHKVVPQVDEIRASALKVRESAKGDMRSA